MLTKLFKNVQEALIRKKLTWTHSNNIIANGIEQYCSCLKVIPVMSKMMMQPLICVMGSSKAASRVSWMARKSSLNVNFSGVQSSGKVVKRNIICKFNEIRSKLTCSRQNQNATSVLIAFRLKIDDIMLIWTSHSFWHQILSVFWILYFELVVTAD